jgi:DNA-3-methyladenine glycosylase II
MMNADGQKGSATVDVRCRDPFDLDLSLRAMRSFGRTSAEAAGTAAACTPASGPAPAGTPGQAVLRLGVRLEERPTLLEIRQPETAPPVVRVEARPAPASCQVLRALAERVVNAALDLTPFYQLAAGHPVLGPLTRSLHGLKPFRPADLFDMLVTAVIEQQISLVAARRIRERLIRRFGAEIEGEAVFPEASTLARASLDELAECGLSRRKAEYVTGVAEEIVGGSLDLEELEQASSDEVRARIVSLRGFGPWSAEYVLIRGLARVDAVPVDDLAVRTVIGKLLGDGSRPTSAQATTLLAPLAPYRGLAAFYLLVAARCLPDRRVGEEELETGGDAP